MAPSTPVFAWKIRGRGAWQATPMGPQRVGRDWSTSCTHTHTYIKQTNFTNQQQGVFLLSSCLSAPLSSPRAFALAMSLAWRPSLLVSYCSLPILYTPQSSPPYFHLQSRVTGRMQGQGAFDKQESWMVIREEADPNWHPTILAISNAPCYASFQHPKILLDYSKEITKWLFSLLLWQNMSPEKWAFVFLSYIFRE